MTHFNREGGTYRVRVVLDKASGLLETFKYRGKKLLAYASGLDFDNAMLHTTLIEIQKDEPVIQAVVLGLGTSKLERGPPV